MGLFDKAKDNYEKRQKIAEWNYQAREYVSEGQRAYEEAYGNLAYACMKVENKMQDFVRWKQKVLDEINRTLKTLNSQHSDLKLSLKVDFINLETCSVTQNEQLDCVDRALATWVVPSVSDLFHNISIEEYYEAKQNMQQAKMYKAQMKAKRDELKQAKYAVQAIPTFISDEKSQIEQLMDKFRKTAQNINQSNAEERTASLCQIAKLIADSLSTKFIDNQYKVTEQYTDIHRQIAMTNQSLENAVWLID
ncbi:MAG: hypothetical protein K2G36_02915 [Ruminococcus sp.]|nr:hypothetical protein [Ruminococcus sp.]